MMLRQMTTVKFNQANTYDLWADVVPTGMPLPGQTLTNLITIGYLSKKIYTAHLLIEVKHSDWLFPEPQKGRGNLSGLPLVSSKYVHVHLGQLTST